MEDISIQELKSRLDKGEKVTLIDVREVYENEEFNIGGKLIPIGTLMQQAGTLDLPKDTEIVVYCRSGNRSDMGKQILQMNGFQNARNLLGGMMAWQQAFSLSD
jgi:rhodanese-related sulfurtransferase